MTAPPTLDHKTRREVEPQFWLALTMAVVLISVITANARLASLQRDATTRLEAIAASLAVIEANTDRGREP